MQILIIYQNSKERTEFSVFSSMKINVDVNIYEAIEVSFVNAMWIKIHVKYWQQIEASKLSELSCLFNAGQVIEIYIWISTWKIRSSWSIY